MIHYAVIGCGFGDEGKGRVADYLCSQLPISLVIRYSGGRQSGHQVIKSRFRQHIFSNFGSGTFQSVPTYWSKYCPIDPIGVMNELFILREKSISPILYIDERCPVTTPYDKDRNQQLEEKNNHGSCGIGIGTTHQREQDRYSLLFGDLFNPSVFKMKFDLIRKYYSNLYVNLPMDSFPVEFFLRSCSEIISSEYIKITRDFPIKEGGYLFEGSQGLLLDQDIGFFPHVARANTGSKNILHMGIKLPYVFLVTRAYQTRHGNGPMTNESIPHNIKTNPHEKNFSNSYQGEFRRTLLDLDLLKYAINKDEYLRKTDNKSLVVTCLDLIENEYRLVKNNRVVNFLSRNDFLCEIEEFLNIRCIYISESPDKDLIKW